MRDTSQPTLRRTLVITTTLPPPNNKQKQKPNNEPSKTDAGSFPFSRPEAAEPPAEYAQLRSKCPIAKVRGWRGGVKLSNQVDLGGGKLIRWSNTSSCAQHAIKQLKKNARAGLDQGMP